MSVETKACSNCGKTNPVQAKFCSGCRTALTAAPVIPASIPGGGQINFQSTPRVPAMNGFGGKPESRQFDDIDPASLYAAVVAHVQGQKGAEIKHQIPPSQLTAVLIYKEFLVTMSTPVRVDTDIVITPLSATQSLVSVSGKVDAGSTAPLWMVLGAGILLMMLSNPYMMFMWGIIGLAGGALSAWLIWNRAPKQVAEDLFRALRERQGVVAPVSAGPATPVVAAAQARTPATPPAANASEPAPIPAAEEEVFARLRKLAELKELGAITGAEFEAKKAELLSRI